MPDAHAPGPPPSGGRVLPTVLRALAHTAQLLVLLATVSLGLLWVGWTYLIAIAQAGGAFVVLHRLARRTRWTMLLVPMLSAALTVGLALAGQAYGRATACSDEELALAQQLAPPPGTTVELEGEYEEGCVARTGMELLDEGDYESRVPAQRRCRHNSRPAGRLGRLWPRAGRRRTSPSGSSRHLLTGSDAASPQGAAQPVASVATGG